MGSSADVDPPRTVETVDGLVRAMHDLTADPNYKLVADVFSEFLYAKEQNNRLSVSHKVVLEEYRKFRNELEEQKGVLEHEKKDLELLVQEKVQEIIQLSAARARLESDLEDTQQSLEAEKKNAAEAAETAAKEHAALQAAKAAVEEEKRQGEEAAAAAAATAATEIAALTEAKTGLEEVKANNEAEIERLKENVAELETAKAGLEQVKADNEAEIASLKDRVATLESSKQQLEEELEAAKQQITSLNETITQKDSEIESRKESLRAAEEQIASLQQTVEDKNTEIDDLHGKLKAEGERADNAEAHGRHLQTQLDETVQNLDTTTGKLTHLEQYRVVLQSDNDETYVSFLDKIWTTIVTLVEGTFRPDIDEQILSDPSCWANLRSSPYLKNATQLQVPLPQSNTPAAKGMRISAVLAALSRAMHKHLFRPVYLLDDDDETLVRFLRALEDEDPTHEAHVRATLLATLPDRQAEQGTRRVKTVVREVSWLVQHLLGALQFEAFCSGLEAACRLACAQWTRIQLAHMKIEPYFGPPYDDFDWQVLDLPEFAEAAERDAVGTLAHMASTNGDAADETIAAEDHHRRGTAEEATTTTAADAAPIGNGVAGDAAAAAAAADSGPSSSTTFLGSGGASSLASLNGHQPEDDEIDPDEILLVVWPSMCAIEGGEPMSITQGLVISKEQARPALEEQRSRSRIIPRPGSRRARTLSMPGQSRASSPRGKLGHFMTAPQPGSELAMEVAPEDIY